MNKAIAETRMPIDIHAINFSRTRAITIFPVGAGYGYALQARCATGHSFESDEIAIHDHMESTFRSCLVANHSAQIIKAAMRIDADLEMVLNWFENDVIEELGGTAMHLVHQGRYALVLDFLHRVARDLASDAAGAPNERRFVESEAIPMTRQKLSPHVEHVKEFLRPIEH